MTEDYLNPPESKRIASCLLCEKCQQLTVEAWVDFLDHVGLICTNCGDEWWSIKSSEGYYQFDRVRLQTKRHNNLRGRGLTMAKYCLVCYGVEYCVPKEELVMLGLGVDDFAKHVDEGHQPERLKT